MEDATRLQIFLDRENFGPGKLDGKLGEFTRKAVVRYGRAHGQTLPAPGPALLAALPEVPSIEPFTDYTVTADDVAAGRRDVRGPRGAGQAEVAAVHVACSNCSASVSIPSRISCAGSTPARTSARWRRAAGCACPTFRSALRRQARRARPPHRRPARSSGRAW